MNWSEEWWIKLYTRDTPDWMMLSMEAQALFVLLLRKVSRGGQIDAGRHGRSGVFLAIGHAHRAKEWERFLEELEADGCVAWDGQMLSIPNFLEAQNARMSDAMRQRVSRSNKQEASKSSKTGSECHTVSHGVTDGHTVSHAVTIDRKIDRETKELETMSTRVDPPVLLAVEPKANPKHDPQTLVDAWNSNCGQLARVAKLTDGRRRKATARLRERPLEGPDGWVAVIKRMAASDLCNGAVGSGWRATFDFLMQPDSAIKTLEGKYDNRASAPRTTLPVVRDGSERRTYGSAEALKIE